jgi:hypothetical protein
MAENLPLEQRAGRNIGIEPTLALAFAQGAGAPETDVNAAIGARTTILECPVGVARTPKGANVNEQGFLTNRSAVDYNYSVLFVDDLGNELEIRTDSVGAGLVAPFAYISSANGLALVLAPGEKIVLLSVAPG